MRKKRSLSLHGHRTSIALEAEFWNVIEQAAKQNKSSLASFIAAIDDRRVQDRSRLGLAAYLRVWSLQYVQTLPKQN